MRNLINQVDAVALESLGSVLVADDKRGLHNGVDPAKQQLSDAICTLQLRMIVPGLYIPVDGVGREVLHVVNSRDFQIVGEAGGPGAEAFCVDRSPAADCHRMNVGLVLHEAEAVEGLVGFGKLKRRVRRLLVDLCGEESN